MAIESYYIEFEDYTVDVYMDDLHVGELSFSDTTPANTVSLSSEVFEVEISESLIPGPRGISGLTVTVNGVSQVAGNISLRAANIPDSDDYKIMTADERTKLAGIESGAEVNVNADWNSVSGDSQILNKPSIPAAQVNSDWSSISGVSEILNKPTLGTASTHATEDFAAALGVDDNYVTDAEKVVIGNTSGTNTGDQESSDFDHDQLQNTHNLTTDIDHNEIANTHGALPTSLSQLSDDSTHRLVTDVEKGVWNGKEDKPTITTVTLTVAGWSGGTTQVATVTGATATNRLRFRLPSSDSEIMEIANKQVRPTPSTQTTDALTFVATTTPTAQIVMVCEILPAL